MILEVYPLSLSKPFPGVCLENGEYSGYRSTLCQSFPIRLTYIICKFIRSTKIKVNSASSLWGSKLCNEMQTLREFLITVQQDVTQSSLFIILQIHSTCFVC